jgi:hypothetical protein
MPRAGIDRYDPAVIKNACMLRVCTEHGIGSSNRGGKQQYDENTDKTETERSCTGTLPVIVQGLPPLIAIGMLSAGRIKVVYQRYLLSPQILDTLQIFPSFPCCFHGVFPPLLKKCKIRANQYQIKKNISSGKRTEEVCGRFFWWFWSFW